MPAQRGVTLRPAKDYLTVKAAAELAGLSPARLRALISRGVFREGVHYTRPEGIRPRFVRSALELWLAGGAQVPPVTRRRSKLAPHLMPDSGAVDEALPTAPPNHLQRPKGDR
jgi:hypothetical protein